MKEDKTLQEALQNHDFKGRMSPDANAIIWKWPDLFTDDGMQNNVWAFEVTLLLMREIAEMVGNPNYEDGLMFAVEIYGTMPNDNPVWFWFSGEETRKQIEESENPNQDLLEIAATASAEMWNWYEDFPEQIFFAIHIKHETPRLNPVFRS